MPCDFADVEFDSVSFGLFFSQTVTGLTKFYLRNLVSCVCFRSFLNQFLSSMLVFILMFAFFPLKY